MFNLQELSSLYKTPEWEVTQNIEWALQWTQNIWQTDNSRNQTGVTPPEVINTWGRPKQSTSVSNNNNKVSNSNEALTYNVSNYNTVPISNITHSADIDNNTTIHSNDINPDTFSSKPIPEFEVRKDLKKKGDIVTTLDPYSWLPKVSYLEPKREYTPIQKYILSNIPKNKQQWDYNFNSEYVLPVSYIDAVMKVIWQYSDKINPEAIQSVNYYFKQLNEAQDDNKKLSALNQLKIVLGKFLETTNLPWIAYYKWDPATNLLYEYIDKAKQLKYLVDTDWKTLHDEVQQAVENSFEIKTFNPSSFWTSFKAKQELRSNPLWYQQLQQIAQEDTALYYSLLSERNTKTLWNIEKKVLNKIYYNWVKPMDKAYKQAVNAFWKEKADEIYKNYLELKNLTSLATKTYYDDILDSLYRPIEIDPNQYQYNMWSNIYTASTYTPTYSSKTSNTSSWNYQETTYNKKASVIYPNRISTYNNDFIWYAR